MKTRQSLLIRCVLLCAALALAAPAVRAQTSFYPVSGRVIDRQTRQPVAYAAVVLSGEEQRGTSTDSLGFFRLRGVRPGIWRLAVTSMGYRSLLTPEYLVSAATPFIEIELEEDATRVEAVTVRPTLFRATAESPVGLEVIGLREIEKSPGANRDVSRIVRSYPGVAFSPVGYRNDLIVRGGGPSENRFFMDGIEIPNINHFATQGATGGPVSLVNADLVREISFYTGAFPADRAGALSSVLDFRLRDANPERHGFKATIGASEVGVSGSGPLGGRTTYLFSLRQSYLQLLFKLLGLPFLPNYIDGQVKVRTRFSERDELTVLALAGIDNMKLNVDEEGEDAEYLLSYLPRIRQETFTVGAVWRHYAGQHVQTVTLSHNYLNNRNLKYKNNDASSEENLNLRLRSVEQKSSLRAENRSLCGLWSFRQGVEISWSNYTNTTSQRIYTADGQRLDNYNTRLGIVGWGAFASAEYASADKRLTASAGVRLDGCGYSSRMARFWRQLSPRAALSYALSDAWSVSGSAGLYYQLPPYTALGFKEEGVLVNRSLEYLRVAMAGLGVDWRLRDRLIVSVEGFYKAYGRVPLSVADGIPLSCKGDDYGTVGAEALVPTARGRAYGVELMARWQLPERLNVVGSLTLYRSEFRNGPSGGWIASAWDNRFVANMSGTYDFPRHWSLGARLSAIGGAPYTPYDVERSSLVGAWDAQGRPYYDYARYNEGRLDPFVQLDVRLDKVFYFERCMLGFYIDLQNVTVSKYRSPDVVMSTGVVENPDAPASEQRYRMKTLEQVSGTLLPTLGITVEF